MKSQLYFIVTLICAVLYFSACHKKEKTPEEEPIVTPSTSLPTISTRTIIAITDNSALSGGDITSDGSSAISAAGVCWDLSSNPTIQNSHSNSAVTSGTFVSNITGLVNPGTIYYVRAYATNANGTSYGNEISFKTLPIWNSCSSQNVNSLAITGNTLFASVISSGIYISLNEGGQWTPANTGLPDLNTTCVVASGNNLFTCIPGFGIQLSTNNGNSWAAVNNGLSDWNISYLAINGSTVYAASSNKLFISTDNGNNWALASSGIFISVMAFNGNTIYAGTFNAGILASTDGGIQWNPINNGITGTYVQAIAISGTKLLASVSFQLYSSADNGNNWTNHPGISSHSIAAKNNDVYVGGSNLAIVSTDNGVTFKDIKAGLQTNSVIDFLIIGQNYLFGAGTNGIYKRTLQ